MKTLYETDKLVLEHEHEYAFLRDKVSGKNLMADGFYGNPSCGLISKNNNWALVAGEHLKIWKAGEVVKIKDDRLKEIHSMRMKEENLVEILTDPWSNGSAVWELNIGSLSFHKLYDFPYYRDKEFTENIDW
jgi:6-phosphogluconate dehydrogenase